VLLEVLNFAIAQGVNLQLGNVLSESDEVAYAPVAEYRDLTCGELIRQELRWIPQAVTWVDYSTTPPTFHCRWANKLTSLTLPVTDLTALACQPRADLQRPSVLLRYEIAGDRNGVPVLTFVTDKAPVDGTGLELGAFVQTINVRGPSIADVRARIVAEPPDLNDLDWWLERLPQLQSANVSNVTLDEVYLDSVPLPNELIDGQIADWMELQDDIALVSARISYTDTDPVTGEETTKERQPFAASFRCTDGTTGTYSRIQSLSLGEFVWVGLAAVLYAQLGRLRHDGTLEFVEQDCSGRVGMHHRLQLSGGRDEWLTMDAQIQAVREDIATGTTQVTFGPPRHLEPTDLIAALR
jgi:hypothetical protein